MGKQVQEKLYKIWFSIKDRCFKPKSNRYAYYGARGITMYPEWASSYEAFRDYILENLGEKPSPDHSLDRINNDGNYEPGNLRWATSSQQVRNSRLMLNPQGLTNVKPHRVCSSKYRGVTRRNKKWEATIKRDGKSYSMGCFVSEKEAALAYNKKAIEFFGENAFLNDIEA